MSNIGAKYYAILILDNASVISTNRAFVYTVGTVTYHSHVKQLLKVITPLSTGHVKAKTFWQRP